MTPGQMERFAKHKPYTSPGFTEDCQECGAAWPCDVGMLWAALDRVLALRDIATRDGYLIRPYEISLAIEGEK